MSESKTGISTGVFAATVVLLIVFAVAAAVLFYFQQKCIGEQRNNICPNVNPGT